VECRLRVIENRVLGRIFGPKRNKVTGEWRGQRNEELYDLYSSPSFIRTIKSSKIRWARHVARVGEGEVHTGLLWGDLRERDLLKDLGVDVKIILKWIVKNWDRAWTGSGSG
jgi:hypothetical protein